jgi:hypothetical protein
MSSKKTLNKYESGVEVEVAIGFAAVSARPMGLLRVVAVQMLERSTNTSSPSTTRYAAS